MSRPDRTEALDRQRLLPLDVTAAGDQRHEVRHRPCDLGSGWRLPTRAEQRERVDKAIWKKTKLNKVAGYSVTGPNGNTIFLPAVGGRIGDKKYYQVDGADYWSGTRTDDPDTAYYLYYYIGEEPTVGKLPRHYGFAVRAVRK